MAYGRDNEGCIDVDECEDSLLNDCHIEAEVGFQSNFSLVRFARPPQDVDSPFNDLAISDFLWFHFDKVEIHKSALTLKEASAVNVVLDSTELAITISLVLTDVTISTNVMSVELIVTQMRNVLILLVMVYIDAIVIQDRCHI